MLNLLHSIFLICFFLSFISTANAIDKFGQDVPVDLEKMVLEARKKRLPYLQSYDPKQSVLILNKVISSKPDYYRALLNIGLAYHELNDYENSKMSFDEALEVHKKQDISDNTIFNIAGWVSLRNGDFSRAEELLKKAESKTSGDGSFTERAVIGNLGELYFLTQRLDEAEEYFNVYKNKFDQKSADYFLEIIKETKRLERLNTK